MDIDLNSDENNAAAAADFDDDDDVDDDRGQVVIQLYTSFIIIYNHS